MVLRQLAREPRANDGLCGLSGGPLTCTNHVLAACNPPVDTRLLVLIPNHHRPTGTSYTKPAKMATRTRKAKVSLLDDRIDILNRNAVEASSAKQVFRTVSATLALVRVGAPILHPPAYSH